MENILASIQFDSKSFRNEMQDMMWELQANNLTTGEVFDKIEELIPKYCKIVVE